MIKRQTWLDTVKHWRKRGRGGMRTETGRGGGRRKEEGHRALNCSSYDDQEVEGLPLVKQTLKYFHLMTLEPVRILESSSCVLPHRFFIMMRSCRLYTALYAWDSKKRH